MFNGNNAALCAALPVAATGSGNPGCNLATRAGSPRNTTSGGPRTIQGREVPFPMRDPYSPVNRALVPVPGYNVWPRPANRLGRTFYGLSPRAAAITPGAEVRTQDDEGLSGFPFWSGVSMLGDSAFVPGTPGLPGGSIGIGSSGGGGLFDKILQTIQSTLPATISAAKGKPYYPPGTAQSYPVGYGTATDPYGVGANVGAQAGAAVGSIGDSIAQHPYLIAVLAGAALLLFMKPPGRR